MTPPPSSDVPTKAMVALAAALVLLIAGGAALLLFLHSVPVALGCVAALVLGAWLLWWGMVRLPGMRG